MLGNDLFKVEADLDLSYKRNKSLILFYVPLIGNDAFYLYEFLSIKGSGVSFEELNKLLNSLRISIDDFEECLNKLNKYKLLNTLKKKDENKYIFVLNNPKTSEEFIRDDLFVRDFILKVGGPYYQMLVSDIRDFSKHKGFDDVSAKFDAKDLDKWTSEDESYLKPVKNKEYNFGTFFDINILLKDMSYTLFPLKYRTVDNLKEIATLADLYNVSYDKMRIIIGEVLKRDSATLDLNLLKYKCQNIVPEYHFVENGVYDVPCELFLMNKQDGKKVSSYDKKIIYRLSNEYCLKPSVINVLLEYALNKCDNRLLDNYLNSIASDLHRNNVQTAREALDRLDKSYKKSRVTYKEEVEKYDASKNREVTKEEIAAFNKLRGQDV